MLYLGLRLIVDSGIFMNLQGSFQDIDKLLQQALEHCRMGKFAEAKDIYGTVLHSHPNHPKALTNLGAIELQSGNHETGLGLLQKSIAVDSNQPYAFYNIGNELLKLQRYEEALDFCRRAIALKPDFAEAYNNLGVASEHLGFDNEALVNYDKAIAVKPNYAEALNNRGVILHRLNRLEDALLCYERAIELKPDYAKAHNNLGNLLKDLQQPEQALACYAQAIRLAPDFAEAYFNRGVTLATLEKFDEAIDSYQQAITLRADYADAYCNRGFVYQQLNEFQQALQNYNRALELDQDFDLAKWNKAFLLLLLGEYDEGWKLYESRWDNQQKNFIRNFQQPLWLGEESIAGKTLLIHAEQGLGDVIQFCRYATMAEKLGATVILEVPASLMSLMKSLKGNFTIVEKYKNLPHFDLHCPLMSLPLAFHTTLPTIPADVPYLGVDESKKEVWKQRLGDKKVKRVGLAWSGSAANKKRSIPVHQLRAILQLPLEFHALQKDIEEQDVLALGELGRIHLHQRALVDFSDTAALISEIDLVISIDTAAAHLAGALAKKVWILLPFSPDFRWLTVRKDSPWYPDALLFRQKELDDWNSVISDVAAKLAQFR